MYGFHIVLFTKFYVELLYRDFEHLSINSNAKDTMSYTLTIYLNGNPIKKKT